MPRVGRFAECEDSSAIPDNELQENERSLCPRLTTDDTNAKQSIRRTRVSMASAVEGVTDNERSTKSGSKAELIRVSLHDVMLAR